MGKGENLISRDYTLLDSKAQLSPTNHRVYKQSEQQQKNAHLKGQNKPIEVISEK